MHLVLYRKQVQGLYPIGSLFFAPARSRVADFRTTFKMHSLPVVVEITGSMCSCGKALPTGQSQNLTPRRRLMQNPGTALS